MRKGGGLLLDIIGFSTLVNVVWVHEICILQIAVVRGWDLWVLLAFWGSLIIYCTQFACHFCCCKHLRFAYGRSWLSGPWGSQVCGLKNAEHLNGQRARTNPCRGVVVLWVTDWWHCCAWICWVMLSAQVSLSFLVGFGEIQHLFVTRRFTHSGYPRRGLHRRYYIETSDHCGSCCHVSPAKGSSTTTLWMDDGRPGSGFSLELGVFRISHNPQNILMEFDMS